MPLPVRMPPGKYEGVDQGIDFSSPSGTFGYALASGRISRITRGGWGGGTGAGVYETLDQPIKSPTSGNVYDQIYYAEEDPAPGIIEGARVWAGQPIIAFTALQSEFGFASGDSPVAPRPPPRPADQWTAAGQDFHDWAFGIGGTSSASASAPKTGGHSCTPPAVAPAADGSCPPGSLGKIGGCCVPPTPSAASQVASAASGIPGAIAGAASGVASATVCAIPCFGLEPTICSGKCWLRVFEILGGAILLLVGIILLGRQLGAPTAFTVKGLPGTETVTPAPLHKSLEPAFERATPI